MAVDTPPAGAMPAAGGAIPPQTEPAPPAAATPAAPETPATGVDEPLGEPGKQALTTERSARKEAEKQRDAALARAEELENASRSDQEKAVATARKEGTTEAASRYEPMIRRAHVTSALTAAGCLDPAVAMLADDFRSLHIADTGEVEGLPAAIEAFKVAHPTLFGTKAPTGSADGGVRTGTATAGSGAPSFTREQLRDTKFYQEHKEEIAAAQREGRITE